MDASRSTKVETTKGLQNKNQHVEGGRGGGVWRVEDVRGSVEGGRCKGECGGLKM